MLKRLTLVLALVLVAGITCAAYAEVQNVKVSGDMEIIAAMRNLELYQGDEDAITGISTHADDFLATITRITISADLTDNVSTVVRLLNERYWGKESENTSGNSADNNTNIDLDLAYVTLKEFLYSPLTLTIGRQELHFGNDMIVGDPDTNNRVADGSPLADSTTTPITTRRNADLSARKSFDAIRSTLNYDPVVIDTIFAKINEGATNAADDVNLFGVNVGWDVSKKMKVEGYLWQKQIQRKSNVLPTGGLDLGMLQNKERRTNVVGARVSGEPVDALTYSLETAFQFGRWNGNELSPYFIDSGVLAADAVNGGLATPTVTLKAWALEAFLNYDFKKVKYTPSVGACYAYFSGDDMPLPGQVTGNDKRRRGWDPMFENQSFGHLHNALFNQTNQHILGLNASFKPFQDVTIKGEAYGYWLAKSAQDGTDDGGPITYVVNTVARPDQDLLVTKSGFLGQELDVTFTYDYTEDVQFNLLGAVFVPGNVFSSSDANGLLTAAPRSNNAANEVIGSMKVTF
ncbi:MAG: alginate export family protein [Candidatus Omnitrophica bacterium]|nr:alginate export family protein [Candidatus Omnitrophota bacterium]